MSDAPLLPTPSSSSSSGSGAAAPGPSLPQQRHREVYTFKAPWPIYSLHWSQRPGQFRLGIGSCIEELANKIQVIQLPGKGEPLQCVASADHPYPPTKLMWTPQRGSGTELMATTGDFLRIWDFRDRDEVVGDVLGSSSSAAAGKEPCVLTSKATLANIRRSGGVGSHWRGGRDIGKRGRLDGVQGAR